MARQRVCCIVGTKDTGARWSPTVEEMAKQVGFVAAQLGYVVLTGGLSGVMRAAAQGAKQHPGAVTVGVLPGVQLADANPYIDIVIPTGVGLARNVITALSGDVMVALPGGLGTLQEMSYALEYKRPVASWGSHMLDGVEALATLADVTEWLQDHNTL